MNEIKTIRLSLTARKINIGTSEIIQFLAKKGHKIDNNPNAKLNFEQLSLLANEYGAYHLLTTNEIPRKSDKEKVVLTPFVEKVSNSVNLLTPKTPEPDQESMKEKFIGLKIIGEIHLDKKGKPIPPESTPKPEPVVEKIPELVVEPVSVAELPLKIPVETTETNEKGDIKLKEQNGNAIKELMILGKIELPLDNKNEGQRHRRKRIIPTNYIDSNNSSSQISSLKTKPLIKHEVESIDIKNEFNQNVYEIGSIIETKIVSIIQPSQIVTTFNNEYIGRLSLLNLSWCLPSAENELKGYKIGDRIQCKILEIDNSNKQVTLSRKHLFKPISDTLTWERIERGDEFQVEVIEYYNNTTLVKTKENLYGVITNNFIDVSANSIRVKVNSKLDNSDLFSFVPASLDVEIDHSEKYVEPRINFIEHDLLSFYNFKNSILGVYASNEQLKTIKDGFESDDRIFSKEFKTNFTLYLQFEIGNASYETTFKQNAIPYFLDETVISAENENQLLELVSNQQHYWFKINTRENSDIVDFSLYNEDVNFFGVVLIGKDKKEIKFIIKSFSFGHSQYTTSEAKKRNTKYGSFLFSNKLKIISPYGTLPFDNSQQLFLEYALLKTRCFDTANHLKKEAGEILRQEGRTLSIIDKFLEYQIRLIDNEAKENAVFVEKYERIPSITQGVAIKIPNSNGDSLEIDELTVVNLRVKEGEKFKRITEGLLSFDNNEYIINLKSLKPISTVLLNEGFYIDKRISTKQFQIQREIIQDFLDKKIKIDHLESLLLKPDRVKTPILKPIKFKNEDLLRTEKEDPTNNQIKAVKKAVGNQNIFLIQGPPGTGKTTVIAEIIQQLVEKGEKVMVSGQNHVAVDNVLEKLSQFPELNLLRVGNPDRIDKQLLKYSIDNLVEDYKIDFKKFILNQLLITKEYSRCKDLEYDKIEFKIHLNQFINSLVSQYGVLKDIYKQRHFILIDGIEDLSKTELNETMQLLGKWVDESNNEYEILLKPLIYNSIDVVFATCLGIKSDEVFKEKNFKFDTVIIDEAGKANIAESLVAIELGQKVILVGDQKQLPPYMDSSLIDKDDNQSFPNSVYGKEFSEDEILHALKSSFFEFIVNRIDAEQLPKDNMEMLNYQHRMHPNIGKFVSESFYDGKVKMGSRTHLNRIDIPSPFNKEVIFFDTSNSKNPFEQNDGFSARNNTESETISEIILPKLFESNISPSSIAIIAPYKSQVANIKNQINNSESCKFKHIDISTLDSFQGKEYDIIIFSFTRSSDHNKAPFENGKPRYSKVGFLDDARRLNVAFSRAKKKLILIGNAKTLTDPKSHFDKIFNYTGFFRTLVNLSNKEEIGNFIKVADLYDFKSPFELFVEKYKQDDNAIGKFKSIGKSPKGIFGLFVTVDGVDCLLPNSLMPKQLIEKAENLVRASEMNVSIYSIDIENKRITLKLNNKKIDNTENYKNENWSNTIKKYKNGDNVSGTIIKEVKFGYFIKIDSGIEGLLHKSDISRGKDPKLNESIEVRIIKIDLEKKQIAFSY
jgi:superfamily I DNA and/or RNA helicase/predicted RNA-binding protein with RPS1 domain